MKKDTLVRGVARESRVRVFACDTTVLTNYAQSKHSLWPVASAALGRTMSVGCIMGSMLKTEKEKITIQINGGGPIGTVMVDAYADGKVRGFVANPEVHYIYNDTGKLAVGVAVGHQGYLKVIKDMGLKQPWIGQVELQTGEIGEDFSYYFTVSEQIPSAVSVGVLVNPENEVIASGGLVIQVLPEALDEDISYIEEKLKKFPPISTLISEGKTPQDMISMIFDDFKLLEERELRFECNCSRDKCLTVLDTIILSDLKDMIDEDHKCDMFCEFCSTNYHFDEKDLMAIYERRYAYEKDRS